MTYRYPHYYPRFCCIAGECEATCCAGWEIVVDDDSIENYLNIKSEFGNRLCNSIDFTEGIFHQDERKRCAFLNEHNLCDIYSELGEKFLCYTCTQYPRHIEEFEDLNEVSLSISCPEVADLILNCEEKVTFYEEEVEEEVEPFDDFDCLFYDILVDIRETMYGILQNRSLLIRHRMKLTAKLCYEVQDKINTGAVFEIDEALDKYAKWCREEVDTAEIESIIRELSDESVKRYELIQNILHHLYRLEVLQAEWRPKLMKNQELLFSRDEKEYQELRKEFSEKYQIQLERMEEQLQMYFVYSYFCGAVYDGEVLSKYLLAYVTTVIVEELWFAKYLEKNKMLTNIDMRRIVYAYAREIEHSDQNLEILESMYQEEKEYKENYMMSL